MHLTSIVMLLSTLGVAMAQDAVSIFTSFDMSDTCRSTLTGKDVLPSCFISDTSYLNKKKLSTMCTGPADSGPGHFCSTSQINSVLDLIEKNCKDELANENAMAQEMYTSWLTYGLYPATYCIKSNTGAYCMIDPNSLYSGIETGQCNDCLRDVTQAQLKWKPDRSPKLGGQYYQNVLYFIKMNAQACNNTPQRKGSKSPMNPTSDDVSAEEINSSISKWMHANWTLNLSIYIALMAAATIL
ncbi:hypothetical protein BDF22DRAFT_773467 [Syncephalis plumigaleata]|nr:hypothetical protein BDF22DRAFT_773467 [Syncephalis plumigaleata]